jgi:hypothetical protein
MFVEEINYVLDISEQGDKPPDFTKEQALLTTSETINCPSGCSY